MRAANLSLRVRDEYDDALVFEGGLLHVEFVDITGDGYKDLVITGIAVHTGDFKGDPIWREVITRIYSFHPEEKEFHEVFACGPALAS